MQLQPRRRPTARRQDAGERCGACVARIVGHSRYTIKTCPLRVSDTEGTRPRAAGWSEGPEARAAARSSAVLRPANAGGRRRPYPPAVRSTVQSGHGRGRARRTGRSSGSFEVSIPLSSGMTFPHGETAYPSRCPNRHKASVHSAAEYSHARGCP